MKPSTSSWARSVSTACFGTLGRTWSARVCRRRRRLRATWHEPRRSRLRRGAVGPPPHGRARCGRRARGCAARSPGTPPSPPPSGLVRVGDDLARRAGWSAQQTHSAFCNGSAAQYSHGSFAVQKRNARPTAISMTNSRFISRADHKNPVEPPRSQEGNRAVLDETIPVPTSRGGRSNDPRFKLRLGNVTAAAWLRAAILAANSNVGNLGNGVVGFRYRCGLEVRGSRADTREEIQHVDKQTGGSGRQPLTPYHCLETPYCA